MADGPHGPAVNVANGNRAFAENAARVNYGNPGVDWAARTQAAALRECRSLRYTRARKVGIIVPDPDWRYTPDEIDDNNPLTWRFAAYKVRQYTATCEKTVRGPRR